MKKILKSIAILFMFVTVFSLAGCGYTKEQKQAYRKYETQGKKDAIKYIEEKYNFEANVIDVEAVKSFNGNALDFWTDPSGQVLVEMINDSKLFYVYIDYDESDKCYDSYQQFEIKKDILNMVYECANIRVEDAELSYGKYFQYSPEYHNFINDYYDGSNLNEILENYYSSIEAIFGTFDNLDDERIKSIKIPDNIFKEITFVQYLDGDDYEFNDSKKEDSNEIDYKDIMIEGVKYFYKDAKTLWNIPEVEGKMNVIREYSKVKNII